ncbi:hypothetical protein SBA1_290059 [Candidatus Sulfotelmatobacter kueseliae]|uniref:Uncharacterized protein n=1 Tax=Candidatus Sulfotelmatobacter kueseliae TaxID=2042962 RepID=A0A2U3KJH7_9BACT|nr:hypothetical protein SBA1_290059 [Candidatus Sulfotelmatobacter kueseliae]
MACITLSAPMAMATSELMHAIHYEDARTGQFESKEEGTSLRMSRVAVTDRNGSRRLQMQWVPSEESC